MGRLATNLAATVANVDNLPPKDQLPRISLWDAFLPRSLSDPGGSEKKKVRKSTSLSSDCNSSDVMAGVCHVMLDVTRTFPSYITLPISNSTFVSTSTSPFCQNHSLHRRGCNKYFYSTTVRIRIQEPY